MAKKFVAGVKDKTYFVYDGDFKNKDGEWYVPNFAVDAHESGQLHYDSSELYMKDEESGTDWHIPVGTLIVFNEEDECIELYHRIR